MDTLFTGITAAIWLGILTSISPCPLATNIAAVSYIGKKVDTISHVLLIGLLYAIGRMTTYIIIGGIAVAGLISLPVLSHVLQRYMIMIIGPVLIIAGMIVLDLLSFGFSGPDTSASVTKIAEKNNLFGAFLLGMILALTFCPVSAALFFGSVVPLAITHESRFLLPSLYGIGTGLPVLVFASVIATGTKYVGIMFDKLTVFEYWARKTTGVLFICIGIYLTLTYVFNIL